MISKDMQLLGLMEEEALTGLSREGPSDNQTPKYCKMAIKLVVVEVVVVE